MQSVTTQLLQKYLEIAPGQRLLTLGIAPALAVQWTARIEGQGGESYRRLPAGGGGAAGETWAIWDMLPDIQAAERLAAPQRLRAFHPLHAADLSPLAGQSFDICAVDTESYPNRAALLHLLWQAAGLLAPSGTLSIAGPNTGGIQALEKRLRAAWGQVQVVAYKKGHRLLQVSRPSPAGWKPALHPPSPAGWKPALHPPSPAGGDSGATLPRPLVDKPLTSEQTITLRGQRLTLTLRPGVFAGGGLDPATELLAEALEIGKAQRVLDLGCGSGVLGMLAARLAPSSQVTLVDASAAALAAAQENCRRNGLTQLQVLASDGVAAVRGQTFDLVLCNPPFHQGRSQSSTTALRFIREARDVLAPRGRLYLVANRFLRYEPAMQEVFGNVLTIREDARYKVLRAEM